MGCCGGYLQFFKMMVASLLARARSPSAMAPPNTRVQRTRVARCARPGSPLTRHPLGRPLPPALLTRLSSASLIIAGVLLTIAGCASTDLGPGGKTSLSGAWEGTVEERQLGTCALGLNRDQPKKKLTMPSQVQIVIDQDGTLNAWESQTPTPTDPPDWEGTLGEDLGIRASRTSKAECKGESTSVTTSLTGRVTANGASRQLEVTGREETCPTLGCIFEVTYRLVKK